MGYAPISIEEEKGAGLKTELRLPGVSGVKLKDLAVFSRQFATMINSGLSLLRSLTILGEQTSNRRLGEVITQVRAEVEKGTSLSAALARHPKIFNRLYISMVRAGEIGGFLDQVLVKVAETFEKEVELRGKIRSAMTYPVVVFVIVIAIVSAMLIFIVPTFANLYASLGGTLPLPTRMLMGASQLLRRFFLIVVLGAVVLSFLFRKWKASQKGRYQWDWFKLKVKVFGPLSHKTALSRFSRTLSTLIRAGVPILQGLEVEPSLTYKAKGTASTGQNDISADGTTNSKMWSAAALSASGTCFWIKDDVSSGTTYGTGATCTGTAARAAAGTKW